MHRFAFAARRSESSLSRRRACESSLQANTRHGEVRKDATTKKQPCYTMQNRKTEISRDFSVFFDSKVFQNFVDAFREFRVCPDSNQRNAFFDINSPQSEIRVGIRTTTRFPKPFKNFSRSKIIYKAVDTKVLWVDLN